MELDSQIRIILLNEINKITKLSQQPELLPTDSIRALAIIYKLLELNQPTDITDIPEKFLDPRSR